MSNDKRGGLSRRSFLKKTAVGAAAVGALAAAPAILNVTENAAASAPLSNSSLPLVAYVRDAAKGEVVVMWGTEEFVTRDTSLVSRIAAYARR